MALSRNKNQVTLFLCSARRQTAESVRATPDTTLRDAIGQSERAWLTLSGAESDRFTVCVNGIPRPLHERVGNAESIEIYPPLTRGWLEA